MKNKMNGLTAEMVTKKGEVLTTKDYTLFKFLDSNRDISPKNFNKLVSSLGQKNVYGASTILVKQHNDGFYYIYEGQHRFQTLKHLKQPIDFIVNQELELDDVSLMNTASEVWLLKDFLKKYLKDETSSKNESYHTFKSLLDKYGTENEDESIRAITFTDLLFITTGWGSNVTKQFKDGTLTISDEQYERAERLCQTLQLFMTEDKLPNNINVRKYVRALIYIFEKVEGWNSTTDTYTLLNHIDKYKVLMDYKNYSNEMMYMDILNEIYNRGQKKRFMEVKTIKGGKEKVYYMNEY
jgi:hypothetical protein